MSDEKKGIQSMSTEEIKITGEPTLDPNVCRFIVGRPIIESGSFSCRTKEMASGSPLLEALFEIEGICQIQVNGNVLTIAKNTDGSWPALGSLIGSAIRAQFASGKGLISPAALEGSGSESRIRTEIEELFANEINPAIASHGGTVELADVDGTRVFVRLGGGCQGCASANITLKQGIEKAIRQKVPEVTEVLDATDHASGTNPFYR